MQLEQLTLLIGWTSSGLLVLTIAAQIVRQWRQATSRGVSPWLYVGQFSASVGLFFYSILVDQWVFVVLNSVMALAALVGLGIWFKFNQVDVSSNR